MKDSTPIDFLAIGCPCLVIVNSSPRSTCSSKDEKCVFGSNASGKSTILRSIVSSVKFALYSFDWTDEINVLFQPYRQKDWWGKPTKITIEFDCKISNDKPTTIFRYELHVAHTAHEFHHKTIAYESMSYAPQGKFRCLFERQGQDIHFSQEFGIANTNDPRKESIRPNASVISTLTKLNHALSIHLSQMIGTMQTNYIGVTKIQPNAHQWLSVYANDKACLDMLSTGVASVDILIYLDITISTDATP